MVKLFLYLATMNSHGYSEQGCSNYLRLIYTQMKNLFLTYIFLFSVLFWNYSNTSSQIIEIFYYQELCDWKFLNKFSNENTIEFDL